MARWNRLDYPGATLWIEGASDWQGYRSGACRKEPWTVAFLDALDPERDCLHNIGANVGSYALIAAARGVRTVAYEPHPATYAALCANVAINGREPRPRLFRLDPLPIALAGTTGCADMGYPTLAGGAAGARLGDGAAAHCLPAVTYRLDDAIGSLALRPPTHLLIDVDGAELAVLTGAAKTLPGVTAVLIELARDSHATDECVDLLNRAGLTLTQRFTEREGRPIPGIWYGLFERV